MNQTTDHDDETDDLRCDHEQELCRGDIGLACDYALMVIEG